MSGWRTVVTRGFEQMFLRDGQMVFTENDREIAFPINQIREVIITYPQGNISIPLLNALSEQHVNIVICNGKYIPNAILMPLNLHADAAGCIMDQAGWKKQSKDNVWAAIVAMKIAQQRNLLQLLGLSSTPDLSEYHKNILPGDPGNREGQAARVYFHTLFGKAFRRHARDEVNSALNYGYSLLTSMAARILTAHGWNPALGIHHIGRNNAFNLACDIMEPFRPFIDRIVYFNHGRELDWPFKQMMISVYQEDCRYNSMTVKLESAMESFALDSIKAVNDPSSHIGVIGFV